MSNREGLAALCIAVALVLVGVALGADVVTGIGGFFAVLGLAVLAWNLIAADQQERRGD